MNVQMLTGGAIAVLAAEGAEGNRQTVRVYTAGAAKPASFPPALTAGSVLPLPEEMAVIAVVEVCPLSVSL